MARITQNTIDRIKELVPVHAVASRRVQLKRCGRDWKGLSPFRAEKTPSFVVNDERYHCFSTGEHGNQFDLLMKLEGLTFPEAVERLAIEAGIPVSRDGIERETKAAQKAREDALAALAAAQDYFRRQLHQNKSAQDYLNSRGIRQRKASELGIGWAPPPGRCLLEHLADEGFPLATLLQCGLASRNEDGSVRAFFRNRLTFPIRNRQGKVVSFGARSVDDSLPKYVNGKETPLFDKSSAIFHLDRARRAIASSGQAILLEGYFGVATVSQAGVENVCATLGTAVSVAQLHQLWRICPSVVVCLDGDAAGSRAADKALETALPFLAGDRRISFARLPSGLDPDDLVRTSGVDTLKAVIRSAEHPTDAVWGICRAQYPACDPADLAALETEAKRRLSDVADEAMRRAMLDNIRDRIRGLRTGKAGPGPMQAARKALGAVPAREAALLVAAILHPEYAQADIESLAAMAVRTPVCAQLRDRVVACAGQGLALDADLVSRDLAVLRTAIPNPPPSYVASVNLDAFRDAMQMQQQEAARITLRAAYQPAHLPV
jgi:DNA primase